MTKRPDSDQPRETRTSSGWIRCKRWLVGGFGVSAMSWAVFAGVAVISRPKAQDEDWWLLLAVAVVFGLGAFALRVALRGSDPDVQDFNLC